MCAKQAATGTRYWLDQYDLAGLLTAADMEVKQALAVTTCISDAGPRRVVDNYDHSHSYTGFFDAAANSLGASNFDAVVDALRTAAAADHYLAELVAGTSEGAIVYESIVQMEGEPRSVKAGQAIALNLNVQGSNGLSRGMIIRNATISANDSGTGRNAGASTTGQTLAVVFRTFSGTFTSFNWRIQQSQDDGSTDPWIDVGGLSGDVVAAGVTRVTTTAATEAWKRVVISSWIGTSAVVGCTVGIVQGT